MNLAVERLTEAERPLLLAHLLALPAPDRALRFGSALRARLIAAYVAGVDFRRDAIFAVHDRRLMLAGAMHVAVQGPEAELGVSVLPAYRRRGIAGALFRRAFEHARNRSVRRVSLQWLSSNAAVARIAARFGVEIVSMGVETRACLKLAGPSPASLAGEWLRDALASVGGALNAFVAGWERRRD
jgi:GNAT superfamily N-acetyltransferase